MVELDMTNFINILNEKCLYKDNKFFQKWNSSDLEDPNYYRDYCYYGWSTSICDNCEKNMNFLKNYNALFTNKINSDESNNDSDKVSDLDVIKEDINNIKKDILWIKSKLNDS